MRILIDECLPAALRETLAGLGYECETVRRAGYGSKKNGELLLLAEGRWDVLLTSDRRIKYQSSPFLLSSDKLWERDTPMQAVKDISKLLADVPKGAWVALSSNEDCVIAYAAELEEVLRKAKEAGESDPIITRVPETETATLLF